ncbi:hypothetical protein J1786_13770 [Rahnella sp. L72c]|uniref:Uncharacterized protein n=2 Tax=Yersiniaceae TaxID=1903411 RepID=A0ABS6L2Q2_9GAMM|nr:hypothetical protein [Rahnella perminowiae]MBU9835873.1 hypothetical protein [Rahnella perminowiae]
MTIKTVHIAGISFWLKTVTALVILIQAIQKLFMNTINLQKHSLILEEIFEVKEQFDVENVSAGIHPNAMKMSAKSYSTQAFNIVHFATD